MSLSVARPLFYVHAWVSTHSQGDVADVVEVLGNRSIRADGPGTHGCSSGNHKGWLLKRRDGKFDYELVAIRRPLRFLCHGLSQVHDFVIHLGVLVYVQRELRARVLTL